MGPTTTAEHSDHPHLRESVLHEIAGSEIEHVQAIYRVELLFQVIEPDDRAGTGRFVCADAAQRDDVLDVRVAHGGGDGVADAILKCTSIVGGDIRRNQNVGGISALERVRESRRVGRVGRERFRSALGQRL